MPRPFNSASWNRHALLTCADMRRAELMTFARGVESFTLMQNAGEAVAKIIRQKFKPCRVLVICGPGNNGGDGFIVAEYLRAAGWGVTVATIKPLSRAAGEGGAQSLAPASDWEGEGPHPLAPRARSTLSRYAGEGLGDAAVAAKGWQDKTIPFAEIAFDKFDLVIDALFGAGLARELSGEVRDLIEKLTASKLPTVSIDLPSGVNGDTGEIMGAAPQAAFTVTFFRKKPGHLLLPGAAMCGEVVVADIGINDDVLQEINPLTAENTKDLWLDQFPFPQSSANKYTRGHALIAGGAVMTGATRLAARAAQRVGAGLVTLAAPESAVPIYATTLESVIVRAADTLDAWKELLAEPKRNVLLIGPGLGLGAMQADFVLAALETRKPCVLDADALGNFAARPDDLFAKLHPQCVLTPHEGEFARLFGARIDTQLDKLTRARQAAAVAGCIVLLKGADTVIADPGGRALINVNAPPWLATAGAGDVLAGFILGLLAQQIQAFAAAAAAAWMHGVAATAFGPGLIAEDLIDGIPAVLQGLPEKGRSV